MHNKHKINKYSVMVFALLSSIVLSSCNGGNSATTSKVSSSSISLQTYINSLAFTPGKQLTEALQAQIGTNQQSFTTAGDLTINSIEIKFYSGDSCSGDQQFVQTLNGSVTPAAGTYSSTNASNNALCANYPGGCSSLYNAMADGSIRSMQYTYNVKNQQNISNTIVGTCMYNPNAQIGSTVGVEGLANWTSPNINTSCSGGACGFSQSYSVDLTQPTVYLPQSGQTITTPINALPGYDGYTHFGVPWAFVTNGTNIPINRFTVGSGTESDCITDNLTGLMWIRNPKMVLINGGSAGTFTTWQNGIDSISSTNNGVGYCGYHDWYLPQVNELSSLLNYSQSPPSTYLIASGFINVESNSYVSSTTLASDVNKAWIVNFGGGLTLFTDKAGNNKIWPVRRVINIINAPAKVAITGEVNGGIGSDKGVIWPNPRFESGMGTATSCIIDNLTGLMWPKNGTIGFESTNGGGPISQPNYANSTNSLLNTLNWSQAIVAINNLNTAPIKLCGYSDWRLPNIVELKTLINYGVSNPKSWLNDNGFFNFDFNNPTTYYWSSSTYAYSNNEAYDIGFGQGSGMEHSKNNSYGILPVRGNQSSN